MAQVTFNSNWRPSDADAPWAAGDQGLSALDYDYAKAFSGIDGLTRAVRMPDGTYRVYRGGNGPYNDYEATATVGPDGKVALGPWNERNLTTNAQAIGQFGLGAAALGGGLAALGTGPFAGGAAAAGGAGAAAADPIGAYLTTGAVEGSAIGGLGGASGAVGAGSAAAGLGAAPSVVPNVANATNPALIESAVNTPGYGLSSAGAGVNAAGTIAAGGGGWTPPSWLSNTAGRVLLGAGLGAAAGGAGGADTASLQGVADTLKGIGTDQLSLARDELTRARERQTGLDSTFDQIIANALTQQQQQGQRSDQLWSSYMSNFLPAAEKYATTAMNFDTPGRRAEEEARARAGIQAEATLQNEAQRRSLNRAGVSLDAGHALTLDRADRLATAKLATGAAGQARRNVEQTGLALLGNTANIGQGIVNTSQGAAQTALTAGNTAGNAAATKQGTYNATLAPTQAAYGGATSATGAAGNVLNGVANVQQQNEASKNAGLAGLGQLAGTLLTAPKDSVLGGWLSDPKAKKVKGKVSGERALATLEDAEVYDFQYKNGMGDGGRHVGRMAGPGDPMGADGMRRVNAQDEIGLHMAAIKEVASQVKALTREVRSIKRQISLDDAEDMPYREVA